MLLKGKSLDFVSIQPENRMHQEAILSMSKSGGTYLSNLQKYDMKTNDQQIDGNDFIVLDGDHIIGYFGITEAVNTNVGKACSLYSAVLQTEYGKGYGTKMLLEIIPILRSESDIKLLVANVNKTNGYALHTLMKGQFKIFMKDDEDIQLHYRM